MGNFFNNGSMTIKIHILKVLHGLESHAKDGRCGLSRNEDIRRFIGKLVEKQTLVLSGVTYKSRPYYSFCHVPSKTRFKIT